MTTLPPVIGAASVIAEADIPNLAALLRARAQRTPAAPAVRWFDRDAQAWQGLSWSQLDARIRQYTAALAACGLPTGARVALMIENGPDWVALEQALYRLGLVSVGIHVGNTPANAAAILENAGATLAFIRDGAQWQSILAERELSSLRQVVLQRDAVDVPRAIDFVAFLSPAANATEAPDGVVVTRDQLASLVYTSGTTGATKGAMMTHGALLANVFACQRAFELGPDEIKLCVLPLMHSFERVAGWYHAILIGAETVFTRGPEFLAEDFQQIRPTAFLGVPRIYERLYARISQAVMDGPLHQRALFRLALSGAHWRLSQRLTAPVIAAVRERFGGRLRIAISGGAPLAPALAVAFNALGVPLAQGYGLTEAGPVVSVNRPGSDDAESAGQPLDNVETRVDANGELLVRTPACMLGYWQDEESSRQVLDAAGWLHTGDKASRLSGDSLVLTGRLKDVLVTSTGIKASPALIEARLTADPLFEQAVALGESRPYLVGLLVAEPQRLEALLQSFPAADPATREAELERALLARCQACLADLPLSHQLMRVALVPAWTPANGLATGTLKPRRSAIARTHAELLERLYAGHCAGYISDCAANAEIAGEQAAQSPKK